MAIRLTHILSLVLLLSHSPLSSLAVQEQISCPCDKPGAEMLYIQGFVPANNDVYTSESIVPAAQVACEELNRANPANLLPNYCLHLNFSNTQVSPMNFYVHVDMYIFKFDQCIKSTLQHGQDGIFLDVIR